MKSELKSLDGQSRESEREGDAPGPAQPRGSLFLQGPLRSRRDGRPESEPRTIRRQQGNEWPCFRNKKKKSDSGERATTVCDGGRVVRDGECRVSTASVKLASDCPSSAQSAPAACSAAPARPGSWASNAAFGG